MIVLVMTAAACSGGGAGAPTVVRAHGTPAVAASLSGAGTRLGDGFFVPRGASLVGAPLPDSLETGYPGLRAVRRWSARLFITGNAQAVTNDLLRQAARKGLGADPAAFNPAGTGCRDTGLPPIARGAVYPLLSRTRRPLGIRCSVRAVSPEMVASYPLPRRSLAIDARQGKCAACAAPISASLATVSYSDFDPSAVDPTVTTPRATPELPIVATTTSLKLPTPGDIIHLPSRVDVRIVVGSHPLTPPSSGSNIWLMRVDHGERELDAYRRETLRRPRSWEGTRETRELRDGWNVHTFAADAPEDGVEYELFQRAGHPKYLRLTIHSEASD